MTFTPTITTQADLEEAWRTLMGPDGFDDSTLWMMLILDDRPLPQITQIGDLDDPPLEFHVSGLQRLLTGLGEDLPPETRVAFLASRPGPSRVRDLDRDWARAVTEAAGRASFRCEVVHLATEGDVRPIPLDEIGALERAAS